MAEACNCVLYIATNCNIVVFMTVCIYRYTQATALYYGMLDVNEGDGERWMKLGR